jgi:hypothetical protein
MRENAGGLFQVAMYAFEKLKKLKKYVSFLMVGPRVVPRGTPNSGVSIRRSASLHSGCYEVYYLLGCDALNSGSSISTFHINLLPPYSEKRNKPSNKSSSKLSLRC